MSTAALQSTIDGIWDDRKKIGTGTTGNVGTYDDPAPPPPEPPPEPGWTPMDLLEDLLGAHLIAVEHTAS